jgi:ABC-type bacteriocin/lantibiotic exporter with double-glycine peptidase domain
MPTKPPLFRQETDYSCAPACLRMVLAAFGVEKTEEELRHLTGCLFDGTEPFGLVRAAQDLGFRNTRKYNLDFDELKLVLEQGYYPIVEIRTRISPDTPYLRHAVLVVRVAEGAVSLLDPARGEIEVPEDVFQQEWSLTRRLTILIQQ